MLQVLTPEQVIESRERLLDDLEEALIGDPDEWRGEFPDNFELYNMILHIFNFWQREQTIIKPECAPGKPCTC